MVQRLRRYRYLVIQVLGDARPRRASHYTSALHANWSANTKPCEYAQSAKVLGIALDNQTVAQQIIISVLQQRLVFFLGKNFIAISQRQGLIALLRH